PSYTIIPNTAWRWGNTISTLLVPQRGMLLGLALAVIVFTQWWLATRRVPNKGFDRRPDKPTHKKGQSRKEETGAAIESSEDDKTLPFAEVIRAAPARGMIAAGIVAGLLPLVHAHSFVAVMLVSAFIALLDFTWLRRHLRIWILFAVVASIIALPQLW